MTQRCAANIPTLSQWGLIIFTLLLLCVGAGSGVELAVWKGEGEGVESLEFGSKV